MNLKELFAILKKTASDWMEDKTPTLGRTRLLHRFLARSAITHSHCHRRVGGREAAQGQIFDQLRGLPLRSYAVTNE